MGVNERVRALLGSSTRFSDVRHFDQIDSTNRWLREHAERGAREGVVVVADYQTAGRGRLDRTWEAPAASALLMSVLLKPSSLPLDRLHLATAAVGLAAREACTAAAGFTPEVKWPNDLLVGDEKLAGVLAEVVAGSVVVGIGMNLTWAPPGATAVSSVSGHGTDRDEVLLALLQALERRLDSWDAVASEYAGTCATVGRRVRVELAGEAVVGRVEAVDDAGRLVLRPEEEGAFEGDRARDQGAAPHYGAAGNQPRADHLRVFSAGDVVHLRSLRRP